MSIKIKNSFPGYIGQSAAVGAFNETLTLEAQGIARPLRPRFFAGPAGTGKTHFAQAIVAAREEIHGSEHVYLQVPSGVTRSALIKMLTGVANRPATIWLDECHDLGKPVRNTLKPILETGGKCMDVRLSEECVFPVNPFQHLWLSASNEDCAARDGALWGPNGRFTTVHFRPYTEPEKLALLKLALRGDGDGVKLDADAATYLCNRVWPNARAITQEMGPELYDKALIAGGKITLAFAKAYCAGELHHVEPELRKTVARYPLGLRFVDIQTLQFLNADARGKLVSEIGNFVGEPAKDTSYRLQWMASLGLTATLNSGRKGLAQGGADYLRAMDEATKRAQAARKGATTRKAAQAAQAESPAAQG